MSHEIYHDDARCRMVFEFYAGRVFLHIKVREWTIDLYREMLARWPDVLRTLKERGYARINAFFEASNTRGPLFARRFGFRELRRNDRFVLMGCENP